MQITAPPPHVDREIRKLEYKTQYPWVEADLFVLRQKLVLPGNAVSNRCRAMHDATARTPVSTPVCEIIKVAAGENIATKKKTDPLRVESGYRISKCYAFFG